MNETPRDPDDRLDLPLGREPEPQPEEGPGEAPPGGGPEPPAEHGDRGPSRALWITLAVLGLGVLLALAVVVGYLLPRPGPPVLRSGTPMVDFGAVRVGETGPAREVVLESAGERPAVLGEAVVAGDAPDAFEITDDGCSGKSLIPGTNCTVLVRFAPGDAAPVRAALEIPAEEPAAPASVPLLGEGTAPDPVVDRTRVEFGSVPVGGLGEPEVVTLGNRGSAPFTVEGMAVQGEAASDFALGQDRCTGETLQGGEQCTVQVAFAPSAEGERQGTLEFRPERSLEGEAMPSVLLAGAAVAAEERAPEAPVEEAPPQEPPELTVDPPSLAFGEAPLGEATEATTVTVRNRGGSPARIASVELAGADTGSFRIREDRCAGGELEPGERCTVSVELRPRQEGVLEARLALASPDLPGDREGPAVSLSGAGAAARLSVEPRSLAFGEVRVTASEEADLELANAGRAPLEIRDLSISGTAARELSVAGTDCDATVPLGPGDSCRVTVRFAPAIEGERRATLHVRHAGVGGPGAVELRGTALPPPAPRIEVSPPEVRFGGLPVGRRSEITTVTVANRGTARLVLDEMTVAGAEAEDFRIVAGSCAGAPYLVPGSDCTVGVRFVPGGTGERSARLVIPHNAQDGAATVELSGTGQSSSER
ncbi:MAG: choice-of-anchor D domain-containing protein [Thermoanaerobaculia bacterium]